jgi:hypothetical protein
MGMDGMKERYWIPEKSGMTSPFCHREERSDGAISFLLLIPSPHFVGEGEGEGEGVPK